MLDKKGIHPAVYTFPTVKPIDRETILSCMEKYDTIVTCEEHNVVGGFGSAVAEVMAEQKNRKAALIRIGLEDQYAVLVGNQKYLRDQYGMSAKKIAERIEAAYE